MNAPLLCLFGPPRLATHAGATLLPDERPTQLLARLALAPDGLPRSTTAAALWPGLDAASQLRNLRKTLHRLRQQHGDALLDTEGPLLRLQAHTDIAEATRALAEGRAAAALALCRGPYAEGLQAEAGGWLAEGRERALALWRRALLAALPALEPAEAEAQIERLRAHDPLDETLLRAHLERLAAAGRLEALHRERRAHLQRLDAVLGLPATPAALAEPAAAEPGFVGRDDELDRLDTLLQPAGARVLLRGPGGIGKTRLAGEAARRARARGLHVAWWPLAEAGHAAAALARLAAELGSERADETTLAAALARRPLLVVADNAEPLLDAGPAFADALARLAQAAPGCSWLVTSRQALALPGLQEVALGGLDLPDPADPPGAVLRSAAVRLLVQRAQVLQPGFEPRPHAAALARLARALAGHPLALEMAAAQLRTASAEALAREAEAGWAADDFDALFAACWATLPPPLQQGLARLAALPASLSRTAARAASALPPAALQALQLRSLLETEPASQADAPERLRLHPLLRHWLQQRHPLPAAEARAAAHRAAAAVMEDCRDWLAPGGTDRPGALDALERELPCLRLAFADAVAAADAAALQRLAPALAALLEQRGRRDEGQALFAQAAAQLGGRPLAVRAPVQSARALLAFRAGRLDEALLLARALRRAPARERAAAARTEGLVLWQRGDARAARAAFDRALALAVEHGLDELVPDALNNLAIIDQFEGREDDAERGYRLVAERARQQGSARLQALALLNLGSLLHPAGRSQEARGVLEQALAVMEAHGLHSVRAHAQVNLGAALLEIGSAEALAALRALLPRARAELGAAEAGTAASLSSLEALLHARHGASADTWAPLHAAWQQAQTLGLAPLQGGLAALAAQAWLRGGERAQGLAWLAWQRAQPGLWSADRREAERLWQQARPAAEEAAAAEAAAAALDLPALGRALAAAAGAGPGLVPR